MTARALLVEEAGGLYTRLDGTALPYDGSRPSVFAGGPAAYADFQQLLIDNS